MFQGWVTQGSPGVGSPWGVPGLTQGGHQGGVHKGPNFDVRSVSVGPARVEDGLDPLNTISSFSVQLNETKKRRIDVSDTLA